MALMKQSELQPIANQVVFQLEQGFPNIMSLVKTGFKTRRIKLAL